MTLEEFEAEAQRLGFQIKFEDFVPHFEHAASGARVDYVPAQRNCHMMDCERTLAALRAVAAPALEAPRQAEAGAAPAAPQAGDWAQGCGLRLRKAPSAFSWTLRRLQEETLSSVIGRSVLVSEETPTGEALEVDPPLPEHGRSWLVLHPRDAESMVKAAMAPEGSGKSR